MKYRDAVRYEVYSSLIIPLLPKFLHPYMSKYMRLKAQKKYDRYARNVFLDKFRRIQ